MRTTISNDKEITSHLATATHIGTYFIKGDHWVKTKTFNKYQYVTNKRFIVTNHYGGELVNATIYDTEAEIEKDFPNIVWQVYTMPLLPS